MFVAIFITAISIVAPGLSRTPIAPVAGPVVERFVAPPCPRCAGHRGVTIASTPGQPVVAVLSGTVAFVGQVAGHVYVVQTIAPGVKVTYGWLESAQSLVQGESVTQGQEVGVAAQRTYLGVRIGGQYVEPLRYLGLGWARLLGPGGVVVGRGTLPR